MSATVILNNFKLVDWKKLFPHVLWHSGRTDTNGGHFDLLNRSGLGLYHYHHGEGPHLHPCMFGVTYYKLEEPIYKTKRNLGFTTLKDSQGVNCFPIKRALPILPMTTFTDRDKKLQISSVQRYASNYDLEEVKYRPIEISVDYSMLENEIRVPQSSIKTYDSINWSALNLGIKFFFKDEELHISIDDAMKIINLDDYYKRVSLDSNNCYHFEVTTQTHDGINKRGKEYNVSTANIWTLWNVIVWKLKDILPGGQTSDEYIHDFKIEWINTYKDVIKASAND